jgi:hypothetical protein
MIAPSLSSKWRGKGQESLINIRPRQGNPGLELQSPELRAQVERTVRKVFEGD